MKLPLDQIKTNPENPRSIDKEKFQKLVQSIKDFPQMLEVRPIVIDENNMILGGNMRLKAIKEAGFLEVEVKQVTGWDEDQKREFIVKDNLSFGSWDWDKLANQYTGAELVEWGFDEKDLGMDLTEPNEKDDAVPETPEDPESKLGDLYELGDHRVLCGDSTKKEDVELLFDNNKAIENHKACYPVELPMKAIQIMSGKDEIIADPFLGSGSTLIASEKTGRKCYGMELDPKYVDVIVQRYVDFTGNTNIKKNGQEIEWEVTKKDV